MFDGGPEAAPHPARSLDAWLVTDLRRELMVPIWRLAARHSSQPDIAAMRFKGVEIDPHSVAHTSYPTCGYLIAVGHRRIAWAPEFWRCADWAEDVDLLFADGAGLVAVATQITKLWTGDGKTRHS
jgi:hypothetical protein